MHSKKAGLHCEVMENGTYYVINGDWYGKRDGNNFYIEFTRKTIIVDDWEEVKGESECTS